MIRVTFAFLITLLLPSLAGAYPLDGYKETGIRRVEGARMANTGFLVPVQRVQGNRYSSCRRCAHGE